MQEPQAWQSTGWDNLSYLSISASTDLETALTWQGGDLVKLTRYKSLKGKRKDVSLALPDSKKTPSERREFPI